MFERCLYFNTHRLSRIVERIWREAYGELGLAPSHAYLLRLVLAKPSLSQKEIAEELHLDKSTVTRLIDKMTEQNYLLRRSPDCGNRKIQLIFPTQKAKDIEQRLEEIGNELYAKMQAAKDSDTLEGLVQSQRQLAEKL